MPKKIQRKVPIKKAAAAPAAGGLAPAKRESKGFTLGRRVSPKALADFTTQFATLLEAGIPVVKSLYILEGQLKPGVLKRVLGNVAEDVESGTPLSEALAKEPQVFDNLYTNMIRAGEAGGIQDQILDRLSSFLEKSEEIKSRVKGALAYPIAVVCVAIIVLSVVMIYVVPKFKEIFKQLLASDLPKITQLLMDISDFVIHNWWVWFLVLPLLFATHVVLGIRVRGYRRWRDRRRLHMPVFGILLKKTIVARFSRTFGTLIQSGVPHLEALSIVKASIRNLVLEEGVDNIMSSIREGEGIARPMGETGIFDDLIVNMVDVGEQTGELDRMLVKIADRYEVEVDRTVDVVIKSLELVLILFLAVFVGFIVFALIAPMVKMMQNLTSR